MATDRPRIQGYIDPELHQRFAEWKALRGIAKDSEALNGLLAEYFGVFSQSSRANQSPLTTEQIEEACQPKFQEMEKKFNLFRVEFKNEVWLLLKNEFAIWNKSLQEGLSRLDTRLKAAENMLIELAQESESLETTRSPEEEEIESIDDIVEEKPESLEGQATEATHLEEIEYRESPGNSPGKLPEFLNAANLARRLRISKSVISRRKCDPTFEEWSKGHDPAGIGWRFPGKGQRFFPVT